MMRESLKNYLSSLEDKIEQIDEFILGEKIGEILNAKKEKIVDIEELAEYIAFEFMSNYPSDNNNWGTYFGPKFVLKNENGQFVEFPSIQQINEEILNYWRTRANESKNPILVNRYADHVFDFEPVKLKKSIDFNLAQKIIDSTIEICSNSLNDGLGCKSKLERALAMTIKINDGQRLQNLLKVIIETEDKFAEDNKPGIWGYAFEWLVLNNNQKISLSEEEKNHLVANLESRLKRLMESEEPNPWHIECAVRLLSDYYAKNKQEPELKSVLEKLESAFRNNKNSNSNGLLVINYLEKLKDIYLNFSSFEFAKKSRSRILNELSNLNKRGEFETSEITTQINIKTEDIKEFIKSIFDNQNDTLEIIIARISINFILKKKVISDQLNDLSQKHPISYLASHIITSDDGYPIAKFGSIDEDYEKHLLKSSSDNLHYHAIFLRIIFNELRKRYKYDEVIKIILLSPVYKIEDTDYILKLFKAFWNNDYLTSSCLSIPLIEDAIRNLYRINNQTFIKPNEYNGYDVHSLDTLIRQGLIKQVYKNLGEDVEFYFKVLLTNSLGWNLRNNFAHGINKNSFDNEDVADRLIHILFCLSLIRTI